MSSQSVPECPSGKDSCKFQFHGGSSTLLYSPIVYDKQGNPESGGNNVRTHHVSCLSCGQHWKASQREMDQVRGKPLVWIPLDREWY